jgi:hypothetical protein
MLLRADVGAWASRLSTLLEDRRYRLPDQGRADTFASEFSAHSYTFDDPSAFVARSVRHPSKEDHSPLWLQMYFSEGDILAAVQHLVPVLRQREELEEVSHCRLVHGPCQIAVEGVRAFRASLLRPFKDAI